MQALTASPTCPWGNLNSVRSANVTKPTLADIMSEQLATKLSQPEEEVWQQVHVESNGAPRTQEEEDYLLALQLSQGIEIGLATTTITTTQTATTPTTTHDEDYLLALKLQAEYERSHLRQQRDCYSKVSVVSGVSKTELLNNVIDFYDEESDEEDEDEEEKYAAMLQAKVAAAQQNSSDGSSPQQSVNGATGQQVSRRQRRRNRIYQKHDIETNNVMNAANLERMESKMMKVGNLVESGTRLPAKVYNSLKSDVGKLQSRGIRHKEKSDHATTEQVLDPRTRVLLFKLLNSGMLRSINGVISTGKESRVYHALGGELGEGADVAIKVYKTTLNEFRDREKYITGDWRFRFQTQTTKFTNNPRKLIKIWAEKEMKNLKTMSDYGLNVPTPLLVRGHCLLMTFIGSDGVPAPRLKESRFTPKKLNDVYLQVITQLRSLYQVCHLVHADLSEFNMLYHQNKVYIIDVAQSVEWDHPNALAFLQKDCTNVINYFRRSGLDICMTVRQLFEFVTDATLEDDTVQEMYLKKMAELAEKRLVEGVTAEEQVDEEVFKRAFIPRTLAQVGDPLGEFERSQQGDEDIYHRSVTGLTHNLQRVSRVPNALADDFSSDDDDDDEEDDEEYEGSEEDEEEDNEQEVDDG